MHESVNFHFTIKVKPVIALKYLKFFKKGILFVKCTRMWDDHGMPWCATKVDEKTSLVMWNTKAELYFKFIICRNCRYK